MCRITTKRAKIKITTKHAIIKTKHAIIKITTKHAIIKTKRASSSMCCVYAGHHGARSEDGSGSPWEGVDPIAPAADV